MDYFLFRNDDTPELNKHKKDKRVKMLSRNIGGGLKVVALPQTVNLMLANRSIAETTDII